VSPTSVGGERAATGSFRRTCHLCSVLLEAAPKLPGRVQADPLTTEPWSRALCGENQLTQFLPLASNKSSWRQAGHGVAIANGTAPNLVLS
jgi:hypothetical protein